MIDEKNLSSDTFTSDYADTWNELALQSSSSLREEMRIISAKAYKF